MTWEKDQSSGVFGFDAAASSDGSPRPPQYRHRATVDIERALEVSSEVLALFWPTVRWEAPPFSGGILDSWPARLTEELGICRTEWAVVQDFIKQEARRG